MASSGKVYGSFSGKSTTYCRPVINWSITNVGNTATPYSDISASLVYENYGPYFAYNLLGTQSVTFNITGSNSTQIKNFDCRNPPVNYTVWTRTARIYHDADGSAKTINFYVNADTKTNWGTASINSNVTLDAITRATAVSSTSASSVGGTSATVGGNVTDAGLPRASTRGIHWGTSSGSLPNWIASGSGAGTFSTNITGLSRGVTYYFRAGAYNTSYGWSHGSTLSFTTTAAAPSVTTSSPSSVDVRSATLGGNVTSDNGATVTERGVCYSTSNTTPTTSNTKNTNGSGTGTFSESITGLTPDTTYYVRAYAINSQGTSYGAVYSFTTVQGEPEVTTSSTASSITTSSAMLSGNVTDDNGSAITERGFVYSTTDTTPDIGDSKKTVTGTTGAYSGTISTLATGTTYYYSAYATNAEGTTYGTAYSFTTLPGDPSGLTVTVNDKDEIGLSWTKGTAGTYSIVRRQVDSPPANVNSGDLVYNGTESSYTDTGLTVGTHYYYRVWSSTNATPTYNSSASYGADDGTTMANFSNTSNALADDVNAATVPTNNAELYCQVSQDGGSTWSVAKSLTFTNSITSQEFGSGERELWGMYWTGTEVNDDNLRVKIMGGSETTSYQIFKDFGFGVSSTNQLTGLEVQAKAAFDNVDLLVYFIKVNVYYGDSPLPVTGGSMAYDTTLERPSYFDGSNWIQVGGGSKFTVSETEPTDPKFGDIWVDISSD